MFNDSLYQKVEKITVFHDLKTFFQEKCLAVAPILSHDSGAGFLRSKWGKSEILRFALAPRTPFYLPQMTRKTCAGMG
jgi:hypothetical protein